MGCGGSHNEEKCTCSDGYIFTSDTRWGPATYERTLISDRIDYNRYESVYIRNKTKDTSRPNDADRCYIIGHHVYRG